MTTFYKINEIPFEDYFIYKELFTQGGLWLWGINSYGSLGDGTINRKSSPVQTVAGGINWKSIASGSNHTAAIKTDGTLWLWGYNTYGQLGDNTVAHKSSPIPTTAGGTNWKYVNCGIYHTAAIKTDGTLWLWGHNTYGQLGDNTVAHKSSPTPVAGGGANWKSISSGYYHTNAIKTDGTLWTWGRNDFGQLGDETIVDKSTPIQIGTNSNWKSIGDGHYHTNAIKTDGTLWTWGRNTQGQLGDETLVDKSSPVQIGTNSNWKSVGGGHYHTIAIKTDGTLYSWGYNVYGSLGDNTIEHKSSPVQTVAGGTNWKSIGCGQYHTIAIKTDGTLWSWGHNGYGSLGDNTVAHKSSPVQTVAGGTNWKSINAFYFHTTAIRE